MNKNQPLIYGLQDPISLEIRYIGKSYRGINRAYQHACPSSLKEGNTPKNNWIKKLKNNNLKPKVIIIEIFNSITNDELYKKEQDYIKQYPNLLNLTDGGPGAIGRQSSNETRKKMSESAKKRKLPEALIKQQVKKYPDINEKRYCSKCKIYQNFIEMSHPNNPQSHVCKKCSKEHYFKSRAIPEARQKYADSLKKSVIAINYITNEEKIFKGFRDAAKEIGGKCSHTGIRLAIQNNRIYYNFKWKYQNVIPA